MSAERLLDPELQISHIEGIVERQPEVAGLRVYEYFRSDAASQREAFIAGEMENLDLEYRLLTSENVTRLKEPMEEALMTLLPGESNPKSEALFDAVEFRYSELFLADMSRVMQSEDATDAEKDEAAGWFKQTSENLYGAPDKQVFSALARRSLVARTEHGGNDDDRTRGVRDELAGLIGPVDETDYEPYRPPAELVERIGTLTRERFAGLVDHIDPDKTYDVPGMVAALDESLDKMGGRDLGWHTAVTPNSSVLGVAAHQHLVEVGEGRKPINGALLQAKTIHELGIHVGRSINAERAGWLAATYGMDGYTNFEEAVATAVEDSYRGKFVSQGEDYQLVAGLAYGHDNHEPRNFRGTYEVMWRAEALKRAGGGPLSEDHIQKAQKKAFGSCLRMFRGTDTQRPGVIYTKDLSYFGGQEQAWAVLSEIETQEDFDIVFAGKVDLSRPNHRRIAGSILDTNRAA